MKKLKAIEPIPEHIINNARITAQQIGVLKNSITEGEGTFIGCIGEWLVKDHIGPMAEFVRTVPELYDYDLEVDLGEDWVSTVDVKTKRVNTPPKLYYQCAVSEFSGHQKCDTYVFVRVMNDLSKAWICGYIPCGEFRKRARFHKKGEKQGEDFVFTCDTYDVDISELYDIDSILEEENRYLD